MRISYLAPRESPVTIRAGSALSPGASVSTVLRPGLHQLYARVEAGFDSVLLVGIDPSITVCVDSIDVGDLVPGAPLT